MPLFVVFCASFKVQMPWLYLLTVVAFGRKRCASFRRLCHFWQRDCGVAMSRLVSCCSHSACKNLCCERPERNCTLPEPTSTLHCRWVVVVTLGLYMPEHAHLHLHYS